MRWAVAAVALALGALVACGGRESTGPTTEDFNQARQELMAKLKKSKKGAKKKAAAARRAAKAARDEESFAAVDDDFRYDPKGKRDPFRSFEWEQLKLDMLNAEERTPLQQYDVNQLALLGVVWDVNRARALLRDPSGMTYIVAEGARVGKNDGRVIRIDDNLVVVKETYVDYLGEETTKDIEMRIRSSEGG